MKVGDLVRWRSWDKGKQVGLIWLISLTVQYMILYSYMNSGEALKSDELELINASR